MRPAAMVLALVFATGARAQDSAAVQQIGERAQADASTEQVEPDAGDLPPQLSDSEDASREQAQLTATATSSQQPSQVSTAAPSAQAPQPLSSPEEGRTAAVAKVEGKDRCDAANSAKGKPSEECKHVIETRAADYQRPKPAELSPEQKLLLDQQALNEESAGRRLAKSGDSENSLDAMGIASLVLTHSQPEEPKKPEPNSQTDPAVQAIINVITGAPPQ